MIFLRLTVKVLPRDRLVEESGSSTGPSPTSNGDAAVKGAASGKIIIFQLPVRDPDSITLGALAALIQEKWKLLRPDAGPLDIKKILDGEKPEENLTIDLTVADVFVQHGKAALDGQDQHGTVLVIQKPTTQPIFEREGSVIQDWAAAAAASSTSFRQQIQHLRRPQSKITTIYEEEPLKNYVQNSVERDEIDVDRTNGDHDQNEIQDTQDRAENMQVEVHDRPDQNETAQNGLGQRGAQTAIEPSSHNEHLHDVSVSSVGREESAESSIREQSPASTRSSFEDEDVERSPPSERQPSEELGTSPTPTPRRMSPYHSELLNGHHADDAAASEQLRNSIVSDAQENTVQAGDSQEKPIVASIDSKHIPDQDTITTSKDGNEEVIIAPDADGDVAMADSSSSLDSPVGPSQEQQSHCVGTSSMIVEQNHQQPGFETKVVRDVAAKRKRSTSNDLPPGKERRLELTTTPSTPPSHRLGPGEVRNPFYERETSPSLRAVPKKLVFSSPPRPLDFPDKNRPPGSMGLGITGSPSTGRLQTPSLSARPQLPPKDSTPSKSGEAASRSSPLRSALRKTSPADRDGQARRSVSFAEDKPTPAPSSKKIPTGSAPSAKTINIAYPPDVSPAKIEQYRKEIAMKKREKSAEKKMADDSTKRRSPKENSAGKTKRKKTPKSRKPVHIDLSLEEPSSEEAPPKPLPTTDKVRTETRAPAKASEINPASETDSSSDSEDIDKELFGNVQKPQQKRQSVFSSQSSAWVPINNGFPSTLEEIRQARRREWGTQGQALAATKVAPTGGASTGKTTARKRHLATSKPGKDIYEMTSSESDEDSSSDDRGDILPSGKARVMQPKSKLRSSSQPRGSSASAKS